mmetsp:Transcript_123840/g.193323  ORF Transcript_123840/g.193323 Transcript_123840/m.193323 type:complete len:251 (-) Transcript_123840:8-760(-)
MRNRSASFRSLASSASMRTFLSASSIAARRLRSLAKAFACVASLSETAERIIAEAALRSRELCSMPLDTFWMSCGTKLLSTAPWTESANTPASFRCAKARSLRLLRCDTAIERDIIFFIILKSCSRCATCCCMRLSISSERRFSAASMRCTSNISALRRFSKSSWCLLNDSSSSSSNTSIILCSSVLPTRTSSTGSTSLSKSNRSPSSICVSMSTPIFAGMKSGEGGLSRRKSVCVSASNSTVRSVSSST